MFTAVDLLEGMLDLDPEKRIDVESSLKHPYLAQYHDPLDEPTAGPFDNSFETDELDIQGWKSKTFS